MKFVAMAFGVMVVGSFGVMAFGVMSIWRKSPDLTILYSILIQF